MILVILSDIHSHSRALMHLLNHLKKKNFVDKHHDLMFCVLGDTIGYGIDPVGCLQILKELDDQGRIYRDETHRPALIGGNHEEAWLWCEERFGDRLDEISHLPPEKRPEAITRMVNKDVYSEFSNLHTYTLKEPAIKALLLNMVAMRVNPDPAIEWYRSIIRANGYGPLTFPNTGLGRWTLVLAHGTRNNPLNGELFPCYPKDPDKTKRYVNFQKNGGGERLILLHGHTHMPLYLSTGVISEPDLIYNDGVIDQDAEVTVINPGSVGLPRDHDRRPSMALLELGEEGLKTTFLRDGPINLHIEYEKHLENGHYPEEIKKWVRDASTKLANECEPILQKRAGQHWTLLDEQ